MTSSKFVVLAALGLAGCAPKLSAADLDEAKAAGDAICACAKQPAKMWGECTKDAAPRWKAIDEKLHNVAPLDRLEPHSKETLLEIEASTMKCKGYGDYVWRMIRPPSPPAGAAPAQAPPTAPEAPALQK